MGDGRTRWWRVAGDDSRYLSKIGVELISQTFTTGTHYSKAFKYIGLNMNEVDKEICTDQADYITILKPIDISKDRERDWSSKLDQNEPDSLKIVIGQLGWITGQRRPGLAFENCAVSSNSKNDTVIEIIQPSEILHKAKTENVIPRFSLTGNVKSFKITRFNDAFFGNLSDGSSQGYIMNETGKYSPIPCQSKKLQWVVKKCYTFRNSRSISVCWSQLLKD